MPKNTQKTVKKTKPHQVREALSLHFEDTHTLFTASLNKALFPGEADCTKRDRYALFRHGYDDAEFLGVGKDDILVVDTYRASTRGGDGILLSVVEDSRDNGTFLELEAENQLGSDDILSIEFLYPDEAEGSKRRKRRGDSPQVTRTVVGVVTCVIRQTEYEGSK